MILQKLATTCLSVCRFSLSICDEKWLAELLRTPCVLALDPLTRSLRVLAAPRPKSFDRLVLTLKSTTFQSRMLGLAGSLFHWKYTPLTMSKSAVVR